MQDRRLAWDHSSAWDHSRDWGHSEAGWLILNPALKFDAGVFHQGEGGSIEIRMVLL